MHWANVPSLFESRLKMSAKVGCPASFIVSWAWALLLPAALFFGFPQNAQAQVKVARPDNTNAPGAWTAVPAVDHYLNIDEVTSDDNDYVEVTGVLSTLEVGLSEIISPTAGVGGDMRFRVQVVGSGPPEKMTVRLCQDPGCGTVIKDWLDQTLPSAWTTVEVPLTAGEVAAITDWAALRFEFTPTALGGTDTVRVSWAEFMLDPPPAVVYYSVGTNAADLKSGTPNVTISGGTATFTAAQPDNIGVGDAITYNGSTVAYISGRTSSVVYTVITVTGGTPADFGPVLVDSIKRAFNSLTDAEAMSSNATHLNTSDLVAANIQLNWPCYKDGPDPSSDVRIEEPWNTGPANYIRVYTPTSTSEVGVTQRHDGRAGTGYRLAPTVAGPTDFFNFILVSTAPGYVRIEGLEIDGSGVTGAENIRGIMVNDGTVPQDDVRISHNLIYDITNSNIDDLDRSIIWGIRLEGSDNGKVWNNIIYNLTNLSTHTLSDTRGISSTSVGNTHSVYNNTVYNLQGVYDVRGIWDRSGSSLHAKNNYVGLLTSTMGTTLCYAGTFLSRNNNVSSDATATGTGSQTGKNSYASYFVDPTPTSADLHLLSDSDALWGSYGADLDSDPNLPVTDDIEGEPRDSATPDIGADEFSPAVFYSVGTSTADLRTGSPTITISKGFATLSAAQTNDIGVGDVIDHDTDNKLVYISAVVSPSELWVQTATGNRPTDVAGVTVNSIKRAFNSISSAVTDSSNASHLNNANLVTAGRSLTWICYDDGPFNVASTTDITGYTTDASHHITLSVAGASQVATGNSQRHTGVAGTGTRMEVTAGTVDALDVDIPFTRIEWLEIDGNDNTTVGGILLQGTADDALLRNLIIHNITSDGVNVDVGADDADIRNIIVYDYGLDGVHVSGSNATIANSTFYLGRTGPSNSVQTDTGASATASVYNVLAVGPETDFFENTAGGLSLYNCISTDASASTYDVSGSFKTGVDELTEFISLAGTINLHLRAGAEAIDFGADRSASFGDDIDDETRPFGSGWDVGADESPYPSATTNYRSIGTAASYGVGTVNVTNLSDSVTGVGTAWLTNNRGRGDVITIPCPDPPACIAGVDYTIRAVTADASLRLTELYSGTTGSETYLIRRQFTTLQAWEDCISFAVSPCPYFPVSSADLVADDRREIGIAYEDSAFTSAGGVPIVRFQGSTTDEFHDITLTADWFNRHFGIAGGAGNNVVLDMGAEAGSNGVRIQDDFITVEWLELTGGTAMDGFEVSGQSSPSQVTLRYNLIHDTASGDGMQLRDADLSVDVYNNIFYGVNKAIELNVAVPTSARILNNTIYNCNEGVFADDRVSGCNKLQVRHRPAAKQHRAHLLGGRRIFRAFHELDRVRHRCQQ